MIKSLRLLFLNTIDQENSYSAPVETVIGEETS